MWSPHGYRPVGRLPVCHDAPELRMLSGHSMGERAPDAATGDFGEDAGAVGGCWRLISLVLPSARARASGRQGSVSRPRVGEPARSHNGPQPSSSARVSRADAFFRGIHRGAEHGRPWGVDRNWSRRQLNTEAQRVKSRLADPWEGHSYRIAIEAYDSIRRQLATAFPCLRGEHILSRDDAAAGGWDTASAEEGRPPWPM
jgi:hypothetical protein